MNYIDERVLTLAKQAELDLSSVYANIEELCELNSRKVIEAFVRNRVSYSDFTDINGYGFYDGGRDKLEKIFAEVLGGEDALVRPHIMSGTNAIALTLSALLKHGDTLLSVSGLPYDSLQGIIGITGDSKQSLKEHGVNYEQIDLTPDSDFDIPKIEDRIRKGGVTVVAIQRSRGYSARKSLTIEKIERVIKAIKDIDIDDNAFKSIEAIINSMTPKERTNPEILNGSRRQRIAKGSGTNIQEVNRLLKQFEQTRKMMKMVTGSKMGKMMNQMPKMKR